MHPLSIRDAADHILKNSYCTSVAPRSSACHSVHMAAVQCDPRAFNPVDSPNGSASAKDEVESPSLSNPTALARFEFESGRSNGTKILMVEWEDDDTTRDISGDWHISWEGKSTVLPAGDQNAGDVHRLYFLLPPGVTVPAMVTLIHQPADAGRSPVVWRTNPLPAIFPPELGASARAAGKRGVLHTIWAKKRLQSLQREIRKESELNAEGVGLMMAVQEKDWIEQNFGVTTMPTTTRVPGSDGPPAPLSPSSPRSPGGGRLMEKLKGLKLGTSEQALNVRQEQGRQEPAHPLSPETSDVAFSSFAAIKGLDASTLAAKPAQRPQETRRVTGQGPPASVLAAQQQRAGMGSLNAFAGGATLAEKARDDENEDDLFALPMSPRSPDMAKSPFSFAASDTFKYVRGERAA